MLSVEMNRSFSEWGDGERRREREIGKGNWLRDEQMKMKRRENEVKMKR